MLKLLKTINDKNKNKTESYTKIDKLFAKAMYKFYKEEQEGIGLELKEKRLEANVQKEELLRSLRLHKKQLEEQGKLKRQTMFEWLKDVIFGGIDENLLFAFKQLSYVAGLFLIILIPLSIFLSINKRNAIKENIATNQSIPETTVEIIKTPIPIQSPIIKPSSETIHKSNKVDVDVEKKTYSDNRTLTKNKSNKSNKKHNTLSNNDSNHVREFNITPNDNNTSNNKTDNSQFIHNTDETRSVDEATRGNNDYNKRINKVYIDYFGGKNEDILLQQLVIEKIKQTSLVIVKENEIVNKRPDLTIEKNEKDVIIISDSVGKVLLRKSIAEIDFKSIDEIADFIVKEILKMTS